jgi:hypothetical protein
MDRKAIGDLVRAVNDLLMSYVTVIDVDDYERVEGYVQAVQEVLGEEDHAFLYEDSDEGHFIEEPEDNFLSDTEADADVLCSIGWGTDEDYGGIDERL